MPPAVHIRGLRELERAFRLADREEAKLLRAELIGAAEPVKQLAESQALGSIHRMTPAWAATRVGQKRALVYIVPKQRGRASRKNPRLRRPNLKALLLDRALIPALDARRDEVIRRLEHVLAVVGQRWEKA